MKELSIEEKARRYDKAIKEASIAYKDEDKHLKATLERIFPELKESEDERIRKELIKLLRNLFNNYSYFIKDPFYTECIAWLEKQAEQKPADRVEPKFHKGDWIVHHGTENIYQVVAVIDNQYQLKYGDTYTVQECADVDRCARLWDIAKDAKDGDVLVSPLRYGDGEQIFIFKSINSRDYVDDCIEYYCRVCEGVFYENENGYMGTTSSPLYPATKEQRDLLFQKMKEAGYKWDADKKELKKIEQNPAWSEEDERNLDWLITVCERIHYKSDPQVAPKAALTLRDWFKSLKGRVQPQPKKEWSEEDEYNSAFIQEALLGLDGDDSYREKCCKMAEWLESLKPQNTWKPSDEQMERLKGIINSLPHQEVLYSLYQDLKKLIKELEK